MIDASDLMLSAFILGCSLGVGPAAAAMSAKDAVENTMQASPMSEQEREVWRVIEEWNAAFAANDAERYFTYIDADITVMTPSNPYRVEGLADDRLEYEFGLRAGYSRVSLFQEIAPLVKVYGDFAYVTYFNRGYYGPEGDAQMAYLKETDVLRKTPDGWKIVHIHVSK